MLDRFSAALLIRRLLPNQKHRRRARIAETLLEHLATSLELDLDEAERWATMGLLAHLDLAITAENERARGRVAKEQALAEGVPMVLAQILERCWQETDDPTPLEDALRLGYWLAHWIAEDHNLEAIEQDLRLLIDSGQAQGDLLQGALDRLALDVAKVANLTRDAFQRLEQSKP